jgi:fatty-acyl-CoA synthase
MALIPSQEPLTPRESRVLELLRSGLSNKQIARAIGISEQTVKYHLKNVYGKLGAVGRTHAVALAGEKRADASTPPEVRPEEERRRIEVPQSPLAFARRTRRLHGDREGVVDGDRRFTYAQFFDRCDRWSAVLEKKLGVLPGDRVVTLANNTHVQLEQFYAVPQIGAVVVPLHVGLIADDFLALIRHCGAKLVCAGREYVELIQGIRGQLDAVTHFVALDGDAPPGWEDYEGLLAQSDGRYTPVETDENELIAINYTSGTTVRPRGAMITHRNIWVNTVGSLLHWPVRPDDRYLWLLPMFHANGWGYVWTVTAAAATHVCMRVPQAAQAAELIVRERVTMLCAAKTAMISMANVNESIRRKMPPGVRVLTAGASPAAATIEKIEQRLRWEVTHAYGLTETAPFVTVCTPPQDGEGQSLGQRARSKTRQGTELLTSGELRVVDEEGQDVPRDGQSLGEIVVRGAVVMKGYYRDPEASARAFAGGWFHTGDAAVMHADGSVEICDRFKDIIISGDELISSIEVEHALQRHPAVREAAVVGLPHAQLGESAHAFLVPQGDARAGDDELTSFLRDSLAPFKVPTGFTWVETLPRTPTGKVRKQVLRQSN